MRVWVRACSKSAQYVPHFAAPQPRIGSKLLPPRTGRGVINARLGAHTQRKLEETMHCKIRACEPHIVQCARKKLHGTTTLPPTLHAKTYVSVFSNAVFSMRFAVRRYRRTK